MCKCIEEVCEKFKTHYKAVSANVQNGIMEVKDNQVQAQTVSTVRIRIAGERITKEIYATHKYCPFCGGKYKELT